MTITYTYNYSKSDSCITEYNFDVVVNSQPGHLNFEMWSTEYQQ